jgi:glycosyltransferase involved in cell wall biosynthesis
VRELFFSIIIPTYNRGELIENTIKSVLQQTFKDFELLIIDDGSTDNTKEIVVQQISQDNRVHYYHQRNSERAIARNNGAKKSKGKYLIFLDSDDTFSSTDHLQNIHAFIISKKEEIGLYFTGAVIYNQFQTFTSKKYESEEINSFDFFVNESIVPARVCVSKAIFDVLEFDTDCIVVEDTVLWTAIMYHYPIYYIPIFSVSYLLHEGNSVNITRNNAYKQRLVGLKKLFNQYKVGSKITKKTKDFHLNRCYLGIYEFYSNTNKILLSKYWLLISIIYFPQLETKHKIKKLFYH